jgi:hypothetical protein
MAGYSGTPLPKKLGIKPGQRVALIGAPANFAATLGALPAVMLQENLGGNTPLDLTVVFVTRRADLERQLASIRRRLTPAAGLWVAWPKKSSGVTTDITEDIIRDVALPTGLVDNKVCAIDEIWSGLRLVVRRELRPAESTGAGGSKASGGPPRPKPR